MLSPVHFTLKTYQTRLSDVPTESIRKLLELHVNLDPDYRDRYRKLSPDEHAMFIEYCEQRLAASPARLK